MVADEHLETLWKQVTSDWGNPAAHGAFLEYCQRAGALSDAAARYRGMAADRERGPEAQRRLQAVVLLATQAMMVSRSTPRRGVPLWFNVLVAVGCVLGAGYVMLRSLRG